ncbi:MAG TPA: calcium-binding protein, partial [Solirubrobacteraceae bacterium]|nr:calcium-binding protein [Solirubrobacteraceae bacterium]
MRRKGLIRRSSLLFLAICESWALVCAPAFAAFPAEPDGDHVVVGTGSHVERQMRAVDVGDVSGDGIEDFATGGLLHSRGDARDDWLVTPSRRRNAPPAPALDARWHIVAHRIDEAPQPAGDVDGDGYGDLVFHTNEGAQVAFSRTSGTVDLDHGGRDVLTIHAPTCRKSGEASLVSVGDANGDGRDDLAFGSAGAATIVFTPSQPRGATVAADASNSATLRTPGDACPWLEPHDDPVGGRRSGVLMRFSVDGAGFVAGVAAPAAPEVLDVASAPKAGRAWIVAAGPWRNLFGVRAIRDVDGDGRQDLNVFVDRLDRTVLAPQLGADLTLETAPGHASETGYWKRVIDDQDGDGKPEELDDRQMILSRGGSQSLGGRAVGSTADVEGDGAREVVVLVEEPDPNPPSPDRQTYTTSLVTWRSSALTRIRNAPPEFPPMSSEEWDIYTRTGVRPFVDCAAMWWRCPWLPRPTLPAPQQFLQAKPAERTRQPPGYNGSVPQLAATPQISSEGVVDLVVRTPRGAEIHAVPAVSAWSGPAAPVVLAPITARAAADDPFAHLTFPLTPDQRALLSRDGRLRLRLAMTATAPGAAPRDDRFDLLLVARRAAPIARSPRPLKGSFGVQHLRGSRGPDALFGASGDDLLRGGDGIDSLFGGTGNDRLFGDAGDDRLDGSDGDDQLHGGAGNDDLSETRFGDDELWGDDGDDVLEGLRGHDALHGGAGDDVLRGGSGPDDVWCGPGEDVVFVNFGEERARVHGCEHVYEEPGVIHVPCRDGGTDGPETVLGTEGADVCDGRGGDDDVEGRGGADTLRGGPGNDRIFGRFGTDTLDGGDGNDELEGGRGRDRLDG